MSVKVVCNSNAALVEQIKAALKENDGYCPCRLDKTSDTKCMCKEFREQIAAKEKGQCHCGLYEVV